MHKEDLPRASKLPCPQQPIKGAEFMLEKYTITYAEALQGLFFQARKFRKNIFRAHKINFPIWNNSGIMQGHIIFH